LVAALFWIRCRELARDVDELALAVAPDPDRRGREHVGSELVDEPLVERGELRLAVAVEVDQARAVVAPVAEGRAVALAAASQRRISVNRQQWAPAGVEVDEHLGLAAVEIARPSRGRVVVGAVGTAERWIGASSATRPARGIRTRSFS
jgi:hypothetical protein